MSSALLRLSHAIRFGSSIMAASVLLTGCATHSPSSRETVGSLSSIRPEDTSPFLAYLDGFILGGQSKTYARTQRDFAKLCDKGDLITRQSAADAAELIDRALTLPDLKSNERTALEKQSAQAHESFRFYDLIQTNFDRFGPGIRSDDPYKMEGSLQGYFAALQTGTASFTRPGYVTALQNHATEIHLQRTETARRIRELELEYSDSHAEAQNNFIHTAARQDVQQAKNHYHAGKGSWFSNDNEEEISKGLPLVQRVVSTPRLHTSLRNEADGVKSMIWNELGRSDRERALSTVLPPYDQETNFPGNSLTAKRAYVRQQWSRDSAGAIEVAKK